MSCTCGHIHIGHEVTELRNLNPDCQEHGYDSEWYNSPEQVAKRQAQNDRLRSLQAEARRRRQEAP